MADLTARTTILKLQQGRPALTELFPRALQAQQQAGRAAQSHLFQGHPRAR